MRDHTVIDLQGKQRHGDSQQVRHKRPRCDLYQLATKARKLPPEPMRRRTVGFMGFRHCLQRGFGAQHQACKEGFEIADRHHRAIVGAGCVIEDQIATLLAHDQQHLPRCHIGQGRPHIFRNALHAADLSDQPCCFHPTRKRFGLDMRIVAMLRGRGNNVKDIAGGGGDPK